MHRQALHLWRSIISEDPTRTAEILTQCFKYYGNHSFLMEIAPQENIQELMRFQGFLIGFHPDGWGENVFLKTLPLLIEVSEREKGNLPLLKIIGKSYWVAQEYKQAYFWYQTAFGFSETPEAKAPLLSDMASLLLQQGRVVEAQAFLEKNLDLSSVDMEILSLYADTSWYLGKRNRALETMEKVVIQKKVRPQWRNQYASFLFEEAQYREAAHQWQILLQETQGSPYGTANRAHILLKIRECEQNRERR